MIRVGDTIHIHVSCLGCLRILYVVQIYWLLVLVHLHNVDFRQVILNALQRVLSLFVQVFKVVLALQDLCILRRLNHILLLIHRAEHFVWPIFRKHWLRITISLHIILSVHWVIDFWQLERLFTHRSYFALGSWVLSPQVRLVPLLEAFNLDLLVCIYLVLLNSLHQSRVIWLLLLVNLAPWVLKVVLVIVNHLRILRIFDILVNAHKSLLILELQFYRRLVSLLLKGRLNDLVLRTCH
jgi:hypothetical protein